MRGIKRAKRDRWIMGVCGGIAHRYGWSSTAVRIATIYRGDHHPRVQCDPDPSGLLSARLSAPRDRRVLAYTQEVGRGAAPLPLFTSCLEGVFSENWLLCRGREHSPQPVKKYRQQGSVYSAFDSHTVRCFIEP